MVKLEDIVCWQKIGVIFVISVQMLQMILCEFDVLVQVWDDEGGFGFNVVGVLFWVVVEGEFFISWVMVVRMMVEV